MKFGHIETSNWENAFRGLRNPLDSWARSDSQFGICKCDGDEDTNVLDAWLNAGHPKYNEADEISDWLWENGVIKQQKSFNGDFCIEYAFIGPKDMDLAQRMISAGTPNDKFLRQQKF